MTLDLLECTYVCILALYRMNTDSLKKLSNNCRVCNLKGRKKVACAPLCNFQPSHKNRKQNTPEIEITRSKIGGSTVCLSIYLSYIYLSTELPIYLSIYFSIRLSILPLDSS